jgi:hypothetical protein
MLQCHPRVTADHVTRRRICGGPADSVCAGLTINCYPTDAENQAPGPEKKVERRSKFSVTY